MTRHIPRGGFDPSVEAGRTRLTTHDYDQEPELHDPEGTP